MFNANSFIYISQTPLLPRGSSLHGHILMPGGVYCGQAGVGAVTGRPEVDGKHTDMFKLFTVSLMFPVGTEMVLVANYSSLKV